MSEEKSMVRKVTGRFLTVAFAVLAATALAFPEIPKESAKALGQTRGKPFSSGMVFVNGKYLEPPYVIIRWGTGIRIKAGQELVQVTGQIVDWNEFLKTQGGVKQVKSAETPATSAPAVAPVTVPAQNTVKADDVDESSLDDLFDDDPKPKKKSVSSAPKQTVLAVQPVAPRPQTTYVLEGEFVKNDASKALVKRVNAVRTEIDRILRMGGFICFGDSYSRVVGDSRTLMDMLAALPELQQRSADLNEFCAGVRSAHMSYLNEVLCADLFRNRVDYRKLKDRRTQLKKDFELKNMLDKMSRPLF